MRTRHRAPAKVLGLRDMATRSKISQLPDEVRSALDTELVRNNFSNYKSLEEWLAHAGYEISKSAIHVYGQDLERRLSAIRASTIAAQAIAEAAPDDADNRSNAVMALVQTGVFDALIAYQESQDPKLTPERRLALLAKIGRGIADLSRASVNRAKWADEVKTKTEAAADRAERIARQGGLSAETTAAIRREILGIAA